MYSLLQSCHLHLPPPPLSPLWQQRLLWYLFCFFFVENNFNKIQTASVCNVGRPKPFQHHLLHQMQLFLW